MNNQSAVDKHNGALSISELAIKIKAWYLLLRSKWRLILYFLIAGMIGGGLVAFFKKRTYGAEYTFVIDNGNSAGALGAYSGIAQQLGVNLGGGSGGGGVFQEDNIIDLMQSKLILSKSLLTAIKLNGKTDFLMNLYLDSCEVRNELKKNSPIATYRYSGDTINNRRLLNSLINVLDSRLLKKNVIIDKQKKSSLFSLKVNSENELFSKKFSDALIYNVSGLYLQTKLGRQRQIVASLQKKTDSIKSKLMSNMQGLAITQDNNLNVIRQQGNVASKSQTLNVSILQTTYTELERNLESQKISLLNETPLIEIVDKPDFPLSVSFLPLPQGIIAGAILGLFLGIFFIVCRTLAIEFFK